MFISEKNMKTRFSYNSHKKLNNPPYVTTAPYQQEITVAFLMKSTVSLYRLYWTWYIVTVVEVDLPCKLCYVLFGVKRHC